MPLKININGETTEMSDEDLTKFGQDMREVIGERLRQEQDARAHVVVKIQVWQISGKDLLDEFDITEVDSDAANDITDNDPEGESRMVAVYTKSIDAQALAQQLMQQLMRSKGK